MTKPTKSFLFLSTAAIVLSVISLSVSQFGRPTPSGVDASALGLEHQDSAGQVIETLEYANDEYGIQFSHPEDWALASGTEDGYFYITLHPQHSTEPITIFVGKSYAGLSEESAAPIEINNYRGLREDESLIGLQNGSRYYTFDLGNNPNQAEEFNELIQSIRLY